MRGVSAASCCALAVAVLFVSLLLLLLESGSGPGHALQTEGQGMRMSVLYDDPVVRLVENFLSSAEAEEIVRLYEGSVQRSTVVTSAGGRTLHDGRTSHTAYLPRGVDGSAIARVERRAVVLSGHPPSHLETLQLVRYEPGQKYDPHFDYFTEADIRDQRTTTIFAYLNDADENACTEFPELGLCVAPRRGFALMWENSMAHGMELRVEPRLKHGGRPPRRGVKFGLNVWFRSLPQR